MTSSQPTQADYEAEIRDFCLGVAEWRRRVLGDLAQLRATDARIAELGVGR